MNYNALVFVGYFTQTGRSASGSSHPTDFFVTICNQYIKHFFIVAKKPLHVGRTYLAKIEKYVISGVRYICLKQRCKQLYPSHKVHDPAKLDYAVHYI